MTAQPNENLLPRGRHAAHRARWGLDDLLRPRRERQPRSCMRRTHSPAAASPTTAAFIRSAGASTGARPSFPVDLTSWDRIHETDGEAAIRHHMREHLHAFAKDSIAFDPSAYAFGDREDKDDVMEAVRRAWGCHADLTIGELFSLAEQELQRREQTTLWGAGPGAVAAALDVIAARKDWKVIA